MADGRVIYVGLSDDRAALNKARIPGANLTHRQMVIWLKPDLFKGQMYWTERSVLTLWERMAYKSENNLYRRWIFGPCDPTCDMLLTQNKNKQIYKRLQCLENNDGN